MNLEVKYELDRLKEMVETEQITTSKLHKFLDKYDYEDDYSGNEIFEMQNEFLHHAKIFLKENYSGQYAIQIGGYAVVVIAKKHFDSIAWKMGWELC